MSSTTFVSKRVIQALGSHVFKPSPSFACATMSRLARVQCRPLYTAANGFGSNSVVTEITSMFPTQMDPVHSTFITSIRPSFPKEIVFLGGAPGAGKGTNSQFIAEQRGFDTPTIVVSDLLNTPACKLLKDEGAMVDDRFVFNVLVKELEKPIYRNGVVVDGFPRTSQQAEYLKNFYNQNNSILSCPPQMLFVMLHVDESASIDRQQMRGQKIMSLNKERAMLSMPPIEVRVTDTKLEASKARYAVFKEQLKAVMGLGKQFPLVVVDASAPVATVRNNIVAQMATLPRF